jgi:hypothetical protein
MNFTPTVFEAINVPDNFIRFIYLVERCGLREDTFMTIYSIYEGEKVQTSIDNTLTFFEKVQERNHVFTMDEFVVLAELLRDEDTSQAASVTTPEVILNSLRDDSRKSQEGQPAEVQPSEKEAAEVKHTRSGRTSKAPVKYE